MYTTFIEEGKITKVKSKGLPWRTHRQNLKLCQVT